MVRYAGCLGGVLGVLLCVGNVRADSFSGLPPEKVPAFYVPKMSKAPVIDGVIDPGEWQESTAVSGVGQQTDGLLVPRPTTFFLGWDTGHLYFATRLYVRKGDKPRVPAGRSQGLAYVWDDCLELHWKPMGKNQPDKNVSYKWFENTLGFIGDCSRIALGQQFKNWGPKFIIKTRLTEPGTAPDGGHWWELEMSTTPEDFELTGPHQLGDPWRMMLGFNGLPQWNQDRIACNGPYLEAGDGYNLATLVENTPAVQMTMDNIPNLASDGTVALKISAFNPTAAPVDLAIEVDVSDLTKEKERGEKYSVPNPVVTALKKTQTLTVAPGKSAEYVLNEKLAPEVKIGDLWVEVKQGDRQVHRYWTGFKVGWANGFLAPVQQPDPTKFEFSLTFNPVRSWVLVKGDTYTLPDPKLAKALLYTITREGDTKPTAEGRITQIAEYYLQSLLKLPPLKPGKYNVTATMELTDGKTLGPMASAFEKKDEAKEFPRWWGKKYGDIERVLPPYEAIRSQKSEGRGQKSEGKTFALLGREYTLNAMGLPAALTAQGEAVLAAPARIVAVVNGQEEVIKLGAPKITGQKAWRVDFTGEAEGAGLKFSATGWLEQDGLVYVDLTYAPLGKTPVTVDALRIEYPLAEADAEALNCIGPGENFASATYMLIPRDKQGPLWSTLVTGISGCGMALGSFYPTVWIGSERRGLLWWADNDQGWVQDNSVPAHEVRRVSGDQLSVISDRSASTDNRQPTTDNRSAVVLINNIVARPIELTEARTISFSYNGTPFKPMPQGWRMTMGTEDGTFFAPFRGVRKDSKTGVQIHNPASGHINFIHPESRYPEEWPALWAEQKVSADGHAKANQWTDPLAARSGGFTHQSFQIMGYGAKSLENDVLGYFATDWEGDTWNPLYIDYAMCLFEPAFRDGGVRSTYWDLAFPRLFKNLLGGLAYQLPDGRVQAGYNGWNLRRFFMRLHALKYDAGLVPGATGFHSTNAYIPIAMPWCDSVLDGERFYAKDSPLDFVDNMGPERFRSMSVPQNWGVGICWMSRGATANQLEWVWMHDSWCNPYLFKQRMPQTALDWGLNQPDSVYVPYWRNPYVTCADKDVLISTWRMGGRAVLGIFNFNRKDAKDAEIKVDWAKLGLNPKQGLVRRLWACEGYPAGKDYPALPANPATAELAGGALQLKGLPAHKLLLIGLAAPEAAEMERATKALPAWVAGGLPASVIDFGMVDKAAKHFVPGQAPGVTCDAAAIQVGMWQLPDRVMLAVYNSDEKVAKTANLAVDLDKLGLKQKLIWQEIIGARQLYAEDKAPGPAFDYYGGKLALPAIPPKSGRLVTIRKY